MDLVKDPAGHGQGKLVGYAAGKASAGIFNKIHYSKFEI